jgi:hypothetical protein
MGKPMKFDAQRAIERAQRFAFPRLPQSEGERRAADLLAEEFEQARWNVEATTVPVAPALAHHGITLALVLFAIAGVLVAAPLWSRLLRSSWTPLVAALWLGGLVLMAVKPGMRPGLRARRTIGPPRNIDARLAVENAPDHRVVVCSPLAARPVRGRADNRTGLAVLAELARTLPRSHGARVELHLIGIGGVPGVGMRRLVRQIGRVWRDKPTLVIVLTDPGFGSDIRIGGSGPGAEMAFDAANDLRLPHRPQWRTVRLALRDGDATVALGGDRRASSADAALLHATGQLVEELILRWARRHHDRFRLARSSQNPG